MMIGGRVLLLLCACAVSCGHTSAPAASPAVSEAAPSFSDDPSRLPRYHSKRLGLSLPLPEGSTWRIDDHSRPELVATHTATHSRVVIAILRTETLMGRAQCEERAVAEKLVPDVPLVTVDDEISTTQRTFDTHIRVAIASTRGGAPLVGHVLAFGGYMRKCYVFDFSTEVDDLADEPALASRLAFARTRILGGLELEASVTER